MANTLDAAIPGQSLTKEPRNYPWERPPETVDPNEAIVHYIEKLSREDVTDDIVAALDLGMPVGTLTESILTGGVMQGIHTVDISLIIAPVVHEYLLSIADAAGIEYKEFFSDEEDRKERDELAVKAKVLTELRAKKDKDEGTEYVTSLMEQEPEEEEMSPVEKEQEGAQMELPLEEPKGLMSRRA